MFLAYFRITSGWKSLSQVLRYPAQSCQKGRFKRTMSDLFRSSQNHLTCDEATVNDSKQ